MDSIAITRRVESILNYALHEKYKDVTFTKQQVEMFADIINSDSLFRKALATITKNTPSKGNEDKIGVTKKEIGDQIGVTRPTCDKVINLLVGCSVVYYEETGTGDSGGRPKYFKLTSRGVSVVKAMFKSKPAKEE